MICKLIMSKIVLQNRCNLILSVDWFIYLKYCLSPENAMVMLVRGRVNDSSADATLWTD